MSLTKKSIFVLLVLSLAVFIGYACDGGGSGVCTEDGGRVSGASDTELKYPCNISAATGATTLTSGYTGTLSQVRWLAEDLAESGFVVLSFTPSNTLGMVSGWRDAHLGAISRLQALNQSHSRLSGKISKLSVCGHSKGGGGALWASAELRGTLTTTVGMAPWQEQFSDSTLRTITAATFIQAGTSDTLATSSMTRGEYNAVGASEKCYKTYSGGHMMWASASGSTASNLSGDIAAWMNYYMFNRGSRPSGCSSDSGGCN